MRAAQFLFVSVFGLVRSVAQALPHALQPKKLKQCCIIINQTVHKRRKRTAKIINAAHARRRYLMKAPTYTKPNRRAKNAANPDMSRFGHTQTLVLWEPHMLPFPGISRKYTIRFTCTMCWHRGAYDMSWDRTPCAQPKAQGQWPDYDHKTKKILADLWGVTGC